MIEDLGIELVFGVSGVRFKDILERGEVGGEPKVYSDSPPPLLAPL